MNNDINIEQIKKNLLSNSRYTIDKNGLPRVVSKRGNILHRKWLEEEGYERD